MSNALLHGLPLVLVGLVIALIYGRNRGSRIAPYRLSQPWTHTPILWSAIEESIPSGHTHGESGGGASGRW